jgi:gliding motility-associated-like protein
MNVTFVKIPDSQFSVIPPRCFGEVAVITAEDPNLSSYSWNFELMSNDRNNYTVESADTNANGGVFRYHVSWGVNPADTLRGRPIQHGIELRGLNTTPLLPLGCPGATHRDTIVEPPALEEPPYVAKDTCKLNKGSIRFNYYEADGRTPLNRPPQVTYTWLLDNVGEFESWGRSGLTYDYTGDSIPDAYPVQRRYESQNLMYHNDYIRLWGSASCTDIIEYYIDTVGIMTAIIGLSAEFDAEHLVVPIEVTFYNHSDYGDVRKRCEWHFGDGSSVLRDCGEIVRHTYDIPGDYTAYLVIMNSDIIGCRDTAELKINIKPSSRLEVPNVFTPNGDGMNDYFQVSGESIKDFQGEIRNRWGERMFEWSNWETEAAGWDGKNKLGGNAVSGVYFYIINATGHDGVKYNYEGFLHLIRGE